MKQFFIYSLHMSLNFLFEYYNTIIVPRGIRFIPTIYTYKYIYVSNSSASVPLAPKHTHDHYYRTSIRASTKLSYSTKFQRERKTLLIDSCYFIANNYFILSKLKFE